MQDTVVIIPCRLESTRLPFKLLEEIEGISLIERCYRQTRKAAKALPVVIAVDSIELFLHCKRFCPLVELTEKDCKNGTERVIELLKRPQYKCIKNAIVVQGDEYFVPRSLIDSMRLKLVQDPNLDVCTAHRKIESSEASSDPSVVKIEFLSGKGATDMYREEARDLYSAEHIGIYAYKTASLLAVDKEENTELMLDRDIELLKFIELGFNVGSCLTEERIFNINTSKDLYEIRKYARIEKRTKEKYYG